jgi:AbiJ N-terminal domain 4
MSLFSRRNAPVQDTYRYAIPPQVRNRLLHTIRLCLEKSGSGGNFSIDSVVAEMHDKILQTYGSFRCSRYDAARRSDDPVVEHFFRCTDEEVMDFLKMCFETTWNCGGQPTVEAINRVLEEENIGYELTPVL